MVTFAIRLSDLVFLSPDDLNGELSDVELVERIKRQFDYLEAVAKITAGREGINFRPDHYI